MFVIIIFRIIRLTFKMQRYNFFSYFKKKLYLCICFAGEKNRTSN